MHRLFCYPVAKQIEPDVSLDGSVQKDWYERAVQIIADRIAYCWVLQGNGRDGPGSVHDTSWHDHGIHFVIQIARILKAFTVLAEFYFGIRLVA